MSVEGLAILTGADLIPARNKNLEGSSPEARSVIAAYQEKFAVTRNNLIDADQVTNVYPDDPSLYPPSTTPTGNNYSPAGGVRNVWLTRKPYVGQNSDIYVMLLDTYGEMSGAPLQINLKNGDGVAYPAYHPSGFDATTNKAVQSWIPAKEPQNGKSYLAVWKTGEIFVAFDKAGKPMLFQAPAAGDPAINQPVFLPPVDEYTAAEFDDKVAYYCDANSAQKYWVSSWGSITNYLRTITAPNYADGFASTSATAKYHYLLAPSGGIAQPKAYKEGTVFYYELNVPSVLYQDIVLLDYYVEYRHDAAQVSILPDKFGPYMYVEGYSLVRRASDGLDLPIAFVIPKLKITTAITLTLQSTGDPSTFTFSGDAYPDFSKFDLKRKVFMDIQILDADDNYDGAEGDAGAPPDPTSYRRFKYNEDTDGDYLWKDPSLQPHQNIDFSDTADTTGHYNPEFGGPATINPGDGVIDLSKP